MKKGFSIKISDKKTDIKSFISGEYDDFYLKTEYFDFLLEGVLLNKKKLLTQYALKDFETLVRELYAQKKQDLIKEFEGEIRGFIFDKNQKKLYVFTNITSTQRIFYSQFKNEIFIDTSLLRLNETLKKANIPVTPELSSLYELLSLQCILENKTVIENIFKVLDGHYLEIDIEEVTCKNKLYFSVDSEPTKFSKETALVSIHELFSESIKTEYEKDFEYNTSHFTLLSGGLDSRIAAFYAAGLKLKPDTLFCFSQSEYLDHQIAAKIAEDYEIPFLFTALDGGGYLKNIDHLTRLSEGSNIFTGSIHVDYAFSRINKNFKIVHTGQIGGEVMGGSYYESKTATKPRISRIVQNHKLFPKIKDHVHAIISGYEREDIFLLRNWGFNKTVFGAQTIENFGLMTSPFMQKDFLKYIFAVPHAWKYGYRFYYEWYTKYCPQVSAYTWEKSLLKPDKYWKLKYGTNLIKPIIGRVSQSFSMLQKHSSMYPYQFYFDNDPEIQKYYQKYFDENLYRIENFPELYNDVKELFAVGNFHEKSQAVNILSIFKLYF